MGFWKEFFSNLDEPAIIIQTEKIIEMPDDIFFGMPYERRRPRKRISQKQIKKLIKENKELKRRLKSKRVNAIEADYRLLE